MGYGAEIGMMAAAAAVQAGANYGIQGAQTGKAYKKQRKLNEQQEQISKNLTDYNFAKQLDMWEKTGYVGQMEQLKKAGLNPGLLYGMGGGAAGSTAVAPGHGNAGSAPVGNATFDIRAGKEVAMMDAQIENIKADTENKKAGAGLTGELTIGQQLQNNMNTYLQEADEEGNAVEGDLKNSTTGKQRIAESRRAVTESLGAEIRNRLTEKQIQVDDAQINKMAEDIAQGWKQLDNQTRGLDQNERQVKVNEYLASWNTKWENIIGKEAVQTVGGILQLLPLKGLGKTSDKGGQGGYRQTTINNYNR